MLTLTFFGNANRAAGTYQLASTPIPVGLTRVAISASRANWPQVSGDLIVFAADISFDAGETWQLLAAFTAPGGVFRDQNNNIIPTSGMVVNLPDPDNASRRFRATLTCAAQFRTTITAEIT